MTGEPLRFPGRREDPRLLGPALAEALSRAGEGLVRGNVLAAAQVLEAALELADERDSHAWTLVLAEGDDASLAQVALVVREEDRLEVTLTLARAPGVRAFCSGERAAAAVLADAARELGAPAARLLTTTRVLRLWARGRDSV